jgi:hypothetical protein
LWPTGDAFPCCATPLELPIGSVRQASLREVWNGEPMRALRLNMLADRPSAQCERCYEVERMGGASLRTFANQRFAHHAAKAAATAPDGSIDGLELAYIDFRFSNLCNFACRSCNPLLSSRWYEEDKILHGDSGLPKILKAGNDLLGQIDVDALEEVYFAGGEPLIMEEHYRLLELLIERRRFSVRLRYSTNFSETTWRGRDVMALWDRFESVEVGASLDGSGARGEFLRTGQEWPQVLANRARMFEVCPRARFFIAASLSLMNVLHLPDLHAEWLERRWIDASGLQITLVQTPWFLRIQVLPEALKQKVRQRYTDHLRQVVAPLGPAADGVRRDFESALRFLDDQDMSDQLHEFQGWSKKVDKLRGESFAAVFPELAELVA